MDFFFTASRRTSLNCNNRSEAGFQTFRFPTEAERRKKWLINFRRDKWIPSSNSRLCEIHFESSQFEQNRQDGLRKLKPNAVPTLFDVPNPPKRIESMKQKRTTLLETSSASKSHTIIEIPEKDVEASIKPLINCNCNELQQENVQLKQELSKIKEVLKKCFSEEQIKALQSDTKIK